MAVPSEGCGICLHVCTRRYAACVCCCAVLCCACCAPRALHADVCRACQRIRRLPPPHAALTTASVWTPRGAEPLCCAALCCAALCLCCACAVRGVMAVVEERLRVQLANHCAALGRLCAGACCMLQLACCGLHCCGLHVACSVRHARGVVCLESTDGLLLPDSLPALTCAHRHRSRPSSRRSSSSSPSPILPPPRTPRLRPKPRRSPLGSARASCACTRLPRRLAHWRLPLRVTKAAGRCACAD